MQETILKIGRQYPSHPVPEHEEKYDGIVLFCTIYVSFTLEIRYYYYFFVDDRPLVLDLIDCIL
jgi:hypothetical protein